MLKGIAASTGVAIAELFYLREPDLTVAPDMECDPVAERARYNAAAAQALSQLDALYDQACQTDEQTAQVFDIHRMMLDDPDFYEGVSGALDQGASAEWAVQQTADGLAAMFEAMEGDEYMQARACIYSSPSMASNIAARPSAVCWTAHSALAPWSSAPDTPS